MKLQELIEELQQQMNDGVSPNTEVQFAYPSGDHWQTIIAKNIKKVDIAHVKRSSYHQKDVLVEEPDGDFDEEGTKEVLLLQ